MQPSAWTIFLSLLLAHAAADFLLQPESLREAKRRMRWRAYRMHTLVHFLCYWIALIFFAGRDRPAVAVAVAAALACAHVASDFLFHRSSHLFRTEAPLALLFDQCWHAFTLALAAWLIMPVGSDAWGRALAPLAANRDRILSIAVVYVGVVFGGASFVRSCIKPMLEQFSTLEGEDQASVRQLKNAGSYIGWLERFIVLTALLLHTPATVGLVLTAKAIVRFPEMKDLRFAEYFLIGTLLSLAIALVGGVLLLFVVYGKVTLE